MQTFIILVNKELTLMKIAEVGNIVEFKEGLQGVVEKLMKTLSLLT